MKRLYLDANGSSPALAAAKDKLINTLHGCGNPSSFHEEGRQLRMVIDEARAHVATAVNARAKDVIFTSGASEANRLLVDALVKKARTSGQPLQVLMSPFEHPSLLKPVIEAHDNGFLLVTIMEVDGAGCLDISPEALVRCDVLIMCQAHNETGIIPDLDTALQYVRPNALVVCDISQGFARILPPSQRVDVLTFSAQKMGGFAGAGGLVLRGNAKGLSAPWLGGGQERGFRPGTESVLLLAAFGEAAKHIEQVRADHQKQNAWRDAFEQELIKSVPVMIVGKDVARLPNTSAISFYQEDPDALRIACDVHGLSVGFGAACSGLAPEGSFALKRLGLSLAQEKSCVRFSLAPDTTQADLSEALERLLSKILTHKSRA